MLFRSEPDGKLALLEGVRDVDDEQRVKRLKDVTKRLDKLRGKTKGKTKGKEDPFGGD